MVAVPAEEFIMTGVKLLAPEIKNVPVSVVVTPPGNVIVCAAALLSRVIFFSVFAPVIVVVVPLAAIFTILNPRQSAPLPAKVGDTPDIVTIAVLSDMVKLDPVYPNAVAPVWLTLIRALPSVSVRAVAPVVVKIPPV